MPRFVSAPELMRSAVPASGVLLRVSALLLAATFLTACASTPRPDGRKCGRGLVYADLAQIADAEAPQACLVEDTPLAGEESDGPLVALVEAGSAEGAALSLQSSDASVTGGEVPVAATEVAGEDNILAPVATGSLPVGSKLVMQGQHGASPSADSLGGAASAAMASSNRLRQQDARIEEAAAGIDLAAAALYPTLDVKISTGSGQKLTVPHSGDAIVNNGLEGKAEATLSLKQLVYDFGATDRDIARASLIRSSEVASLDDQGEDLAMKVALAYIRVVEGRALLGVVDATIRAHQQLAEIIRANEREGNGTAADVNRVNARLIDINAIRTDITLSMQGGEEEFFRLTGKKPGRLAPVPALTGRLPPDAATATRLAEQRHPGLAAVRLVSRSLDEERAAQDLGTRPKVEFQFDGINTNVIAAGASGASDFEGRAMVSLRYRLWDGGVAAATDRQLEARRIGSDESFADQRRTIESDVRQAYRAVEAARNKRRLLESGVETSDNVQGLYLEQFKAGQRTVFELLDAQMASFTARRSAVEARYEGERAALTVLRAIGSVRSTIATARSGAADPMRPAARATRRSRQSRSGTPLRASRNARSKR